MLKLQLSGRISDVSMKHYMDKFNFNVVPIEGDVEYKVFDFQKILANYANVVDSFPM